MRIKTVGLLSGVAMMLTSLTVWSVTPKGGFEGTLRAEAKTYGVPEVEVETWKFDDGGTVRLEGRLGHAKVAADQGQENFIMLRAHAPAGTVAQTQAPLDVAIVIDRSGSMAGQRMQNARDAAKGMVSQLRDGDTVSVITYDTATDVLVSPTPVNATNRSTILAAIDGISPGGDTCISCAIDAGMSALNGRDGAVKRILLLSDGEATAGVRDIPGFNRLAERARDMGCSISSIGVDVNYNEQIMSALAIGSNGRHYFVENASGLPKVFEEEHRSLTQTVASCGEVRVKLAPGVRVRQVFGRVFRQEGDTLVVPMGTFSVGEEKTLLVKVDLPRQAEGLEEVADVSFSFDDLATGQPGGCHGSLMAEVTEDTTEAAVLDPVVAGRLSRAQTAATLREANRLFQEGQAANARAQLQSLRRKIQQRRNAVAKRPKPAPGWVFDDLDVQAKAAADAEAGFAVPPSASPAQPAPPPRKSRAQVRRNAEAADAFSL